MDIKSGQAESHPTPLPLDTAATPGVAPPTRVFASGNEQGGVLQDISGVNFTADATAAMHAGMAADAGRRTGYATDMSPLGASYGDEMALPGVTSDMSKHTGSPGSPDSGPAG